SRRGTWSACERERMMGFEPTTFCMASRRSSQLSYIRVARRVYPPLGAVQGLVHEAVGKLVVGAADGCVRHFLEPFGQFPLRAVKGSQGIVLDLVLAAHLLDEELRVGDDLELGHAQLQRLLEA